MANYDVETWVSSVKPLVDVVEEFETQIETVDATKDIISSGVIPVGSNAQAFIVYEA